MRSKARSIWSQSFTRRVKSSRYFGPHWLGIASLACMNLLAAPLVPAEERPDTTPAVTLEPITVTASPLGQEELHIAQPVRVLRGEELRRRQGLTLGETLSRELGVTASDFGVGSSRPVIRGLGGSRVRVLEGGIGSLDVSNLSPDHAVSIDPLQADQIEILKGPATLLYGSGAIGGVVNVVNRRIPTELFTRPEGVLNFRYDAATGEFSGGGRVEAGYQNVAAHIDGLRRSTSGYDIPGFGSLNPPPEETSGTLRNSDLDTENIAGGASYVGDRGYLGFSVAHFATNYGIPGSGAEAGARIDLDQLRYDISGELKNPVPGFSKAKFKLGHNDYQHQESEGTGEVATTFLNDAYEGRIELTHNPFMEWRGVVGVQVQHQDFVASGAEALTPPVLAKSIGVFAVEERDWHFELGGRFENTDYDADEGQPDVDHQLYSLSAGTIWNFHKGYAASFNFTRAERAPSIEEHYNNGPHLATRSFERGSADLGKETANNFDLSLRKTSGPWTWRVNLFANHIEDFIYTRNVDENGDGVADRVNAEGEPVAAGEDGLQVLDFVQGDALFLGTEVETRLRLLQSKVYGNLDARVFFDYVSGRLTQGEDLPRITPPRFGGSLDYENGPWRSSFEVQRVENQNQTAPLETPTDGYTLVDLGVGYTLKSKPADLNIAVRGTNLLNEDIRRHTSFIKDIAPLPGRSVSLSLQLNF